MKYLIVPNRRSARRLTAPTLVALALAVLVISGAPCAAVADQPLPRAHAHNDYYHDRPLLDALDHGFCSVEADIFLVEGQLLVAHTKFELKADRTLESLYLKPLAKRVAANGGRVYPGGPEFTLMIDIKTDGVNAYRKLHDLLATYADMLVTVRHGQVEPGAVRVVISGDRPWCYMAHQPVRYAGVDGRVGDLFRLDRTMLPDHMLPMISDRWSSHFSWNGDGAMPKEQRDKLDAIVKAAHAQGRRVRFWATPEKKAVWQVLLDAGVDLINTDELGKLQGFLGQAARSGALRFFEMNCGEMTNV